LTKAQSLKPWRQLKGKSAPKKRRRRHVEELGSFPHLPDFSSTLLAWYDRNGRALPWREDRDPYRVWLSEIMLQQTRVAAVIDHYRKFLEKFPNVRKLAQARESSVLAAWSGLGYYRRARMLHAAAKAVVKEHACEFPRTAAGLRELPGIGRYTAAAIASIAFGEPVAVVDGNVERVLSRAYGRRLEAEDLWQAAQQLLQQDAASHARPGDFNQALMELGATVCVPGEPKCLLCPAAQLCATRGELPAIAAKSRQKKRNIVYGLAQHDGQVMLIQRAAHESLMAGMWELPLLTNINATHETLLNVRHSITVTDYSVRVVALKSVALNVTTNGEHPRAGGRDGACPASKHDENKDGPSPVSTPDQILLAGGKWFAASRLTALPLTGLARKILRRTGII
jgi:A/G-specific adenine glycosylase